MGSRPISARAQAFRSRGRPGRGAVRGGSSQRGVAPGRASASGALRHGDTRELVISFGKTGYVALYRFVPHRAEVACSGSRTSGS